MRDATFGGLKVHLTGGADRSGGGDGPVVVLLHGFGAPGTDLVPLARVLDVPRGTRFVFPEAPLSLGWQFAGGRAWWLIDIDAMQQAMMEGRQRELASTVPEGLPEARQNLLALLDDVERTMAPPKLILGGFSQGAMLACDVALHSDRPLAGLVLMSGTLLAEEEWKKLAPRRLGLRVVQSHGSEDPLLPVDGAERLRGLLEGAGLAVEWVRFRGGHEIPERVLERMGALITEVT
ncbi:MAG: esterase [Myxococcales bacterium]|nr:esterase [Myxococcales bacterium]